MILPKFFDPDMAGEGRPDPAARYDISMSAASAIR
jgi:hypothetical protein